MKHFFARGFLLAMTVAVVLSLSGCSKPPDDIVKAAVTAGAQVQLTRANPFAVTAQSVLLSYTITNKYKANGMLVYDFKAQMQVSGGYGQPQTQVITAIGTVAFQKNGNRWDYQTLL